MSNIIETVVNWKSLDIEFLDKFIEDNNLSDEEVMETARNCAFDMGDDVTQRIDIVIEIAMQQAWDNFREELDGYINKNDLDLDTSNINPNIHINYCDSSYDSFVEDFDLSNFSQENIENFIEAWHESDQIS